MAPLFHFALGSLYQSSKGIWGIPRNPLIASSLPQAEHIFASQYLDRVA